MYILEIHNFEVNTTIRVPLTKVTIRTGDYLKSLTANGMRAIRIYQVIQTPSIKANVIWAEVWDGQFEPKFRFGVPTEYLL